MNGTMVDLLSGYLSGDNISESKRTLGDLKNVFQDEAARAQMSPATIVYEVQSHMAVKDGTPGGLFFGTSNVMPGQVGGEYFMTKGHYHARRECGEYYWCIQGTGALILMDESGKCWFEPMQPGSLHYIPATSRTASPIRAIRPCASARAGRPTRDMTMRPSPNMASPRG